MIIFVEENNNMLVTASFPPNIERNLDRVSEVFFSPGLLDGTIESISSIPSVQRR